MILFLIIYTLSTMYCYLNIKNNLDEYDVEFDLADLVICLFPIYNTILAFLYILCNICEKDEY